MKNEPQREVFERKWSERHGTGIGELASKRVGKRYTDITLQQAWEAFNWGLDKPKNKDSGKALSDLLEAADRYAGIRFGRAVDDSSLKHKRDAVLLAAQALKPPTSIGLSILEALGRRTNGVTLQSRPDTQDWPHRWRAVWHRGSRYRDAANVVAFGPTAESALQALWALTGDSALEENRIANIQAAIDSSGGIK